MGSLVPLFLPGLREGVSMLVRAGHTSNDFDMRNWYLVANVLIYRDIEQHILHSFSTRR